jgi:RNA polymerase sigma factor, sigma-70 family
MIKGNLYAEVDLLSAVRKGDQLNSAIYFIYQQYSQTISSFILANSGTEQDAEDVFQETVVTFIDLVRKNKYRGEAGIKTFLVSIARNIWLNELKKKQRSGIREQIFENNREHKELDVSQYIADREIKQQFMAIIDRLGEHCKKILTLFYYENLSMKEIVQHLPYENEQVVRNKKYKCLQHLTGMVRDNPAIARMISNKP